MIANIEEIPAPSAFSKARFGALRRWWIEINLPGRDADLSVDEWDALAKRYVAAGGTTEHFEALIEREVRES